MKKIYNTNSYSPDELEQATGFDRRTIAYYVQEGLLPKVGRRGPRTRYPKAVRDRLLVIKAIREAEDRGEVPPITLRGIRRFFQEFPQEMVAQIADKEVPFPSSWLSVYAKEGTRPRERARRREAALDARRREGAAPSKARSHPESSNLSLPRVEEASAPFEDMAWFEDLPMEQLELDEVTTLSPEDEEALLDASFAEPVAMEVATSLTALERSAQALADSAPSSAERWSRVAITPNIMLSVRSAREADVATLEHLAQALRRMIEGDDDTHGAS